ncbi:MAG: acyltransferase, partial [Acidobacteria bacterium]|nr:acyltransferase [Acidobacteriota bacterium]
AGGEGELVADSRTPSSEGTSFSQSGRLVHLDAVRGFAVLAILIQHFIVPLPSGPESLWLRTVQSTFLQHGFKAVSVFFVLSGFLIGGILVREISSTHSLNAHRFYVRRVFRIWPAYVVWLAMTFVWLWARTPLWIVYTNDLHYLALRALWPNFLHLQNYVQGTPPEVWSVHASHTWSLAVEEHFYLILPLVLLCVVGLGRLSKRLIGIGLPLSILLIIAVGIASRSYLVNIGGTVGAPGDFQAQWAMNWPTHLRIDELGIGVMMGYLLVYAKDVVLRLRPWRLLLLALGFVVVICSDSVGAKLGLNTYVLAPVLNASGGALIVLWAWLADQSLRAKIVGIPVQAIAYVGVISYAVYLMHFPFGQYVAYTSAPIIRTEHSVVNYFLCLFLYLFAAMIFGAALHYLVERPGMRLRDKWSKNEHKQVSFEKGLVNPSQT